MFRFQCLLLRFVDFYVDFAENFHIPRPFAQSTNSTWQDNGEYKSVGREHQLHSSSLERNKNKFEEVCKILIGTPNNQQGQKNGHVPFCCDPRNFSRDRGERFRTVSRLFLLLFYLLTFTTTMQLVPDNSNQVRWKGSGRDSEDSGHSQVSGLRPDHKRRYRNQQNQTGPASVLHF